MRRLALIPAGLGLTVLAVAITLSATDPTPAHLPPCTDAIADAGGSCEGPILPLCPTEDSDNCQWIATIQGNGEGRSFFVIDGDVTYYGE